MSQSERTNPICPFYRNKYLKTVNKRTNAFLFASCLVELKLCMIAMNDQCSTGLAIESDKKNNSFISCVYLYFYFFNCNYFVYLIHFFLRISHSFLKMYGMWSFCLVLPANLQLNSLPCGQS